MGYRVIDPETVEETPERPCVQRSVGTEAGLQNVALNVYEVAPGEQIPLAYHYHDDQEEVFYVLDGELHVETPDEEYVVPEDHLFVVEPDSPQRAFNPDAADATVRTLALGAPSIHDVHAYEPES